MKFFIQEYMNAEYNDKDCDEPEFKKRKNFEFHCNSVDYERKHDEETQAENPELNYRCPSENFSERNHPVTPSEQSNGKIDIL